MMDSELDKASEKMDLRQCQAALSPTIREARKDLKIMENIHNFHVRKNKTGKSLRSTCLPWYHYLWGQNKSMLFKSFFGAFLALVLKVLDKNGYIEVDNFAPTYFTVFGVAVALLLVFQANTCYARFWEARGHLGKVGMSTYDLARQVIAYAQCKDEKEKKIQAHIVLCLQGFYYLMAEQLCGTSDEDLKYIDVLTEAERVEVLKYPKSRSLIMASWITHDINTLRKSQSITEIEAVGMDKTLQKLVNGFFGATKIKNTGIPVAYTYMINSMAVGWCWCVSVTFVDSFEWGSPGFAFILCFCFFSITAVAEELEDPFGVDINDLPLHTFGNGVKRNMQMVIKEYGFPKNKERDLESKKNEK